MNNPGLNKAKAPKDWKCQECGKKMTLKAAERAKNGLIK